jgi:hypothetical protein
LFFNSLEGRNRYKHTCVYMLRRALCYVPNSCMNLNLFWPAGLFATPQVGESLTRT